jgi:hypothetical protein
MVSAFKVTLYTKAFDRIGWVGDVLSLRATIRHNALSLFDFTVRSSHKYADALLTPGTRVVVEYEGAHLISGPVRQWAGDMASGSLTFTVEDDFRLLSRILGWPVPGSAIASQSGAAYHTVTDNAETVVKTFVGDNATRLALPVTVATDLGRGDVIKVKVRMHPLADRLFPKVDKAGIGVTVRQSGAGLVVDCYEPATYPRTLTVASGIVRDWSIASVGPKSTRAIVGGGGEGTAREFRRVIDSTLEAAWGDKVEVFVDARDTTDDDELDQRAQDAIDEGVPTRGLSVTLAETTNFKYGAAFNVGDIVTIEVVPGLTVTDVLREVVLTWDTTDGLRVRPAVGDPNGTDPINVITKKVAALARGLRNQNARS